MQDIYFLNFSGDGSQAKLNSSTLPSSYPIEHLKSRNLAACEESNSNGRGWNLSLKVKSGEVALPNLTVRIVD